MSGRMPRYATGTGSLPSWRASSKAELVGVRIPLHRAGAHPALHAQVLAVVRRLARDELVHLEVVGRGAPDAGVDEIRHRRGDDHGPEEEAALVQHRGLGSIGTLVGVPVPCKTADSRTHAGHSRYARRRLSDSYRRCRGASFLAVGSSARPSRRGPIATPSTSCPDECQQLVDVGRPHLRLDARDRLAKVQARAEQDAKRASAGPGCARRRTRCAADRPGSTRAPCAYRP